MSIIMKSYLALIEDNEFHHRLMETVDRLFINDTLSLGHDYIAAKNLFHAFPSDNAYTFKIESYVGDIKANGYNSVFTTELAYRSLHDYYQSIVGKLDNTNFEGIKKQFPHLYPPMLSSVENYSQIKQNIFANVADVFSVGAKAKQHAHLYDMSEALFQLYNDGNTVLLPCGWKGHSIDVILNKELNLFIVANGGESFSALSSGINAYHYQFPFGMEDFYQILTNEERMTLEFKQFYDHGLSPAVDYSLTLPYQSFGNCAWYSQQLSERALLFMELNEVLNNHDLADAISSQWFTQLDNFHQTMVLEDYLEKPYLEVAVLGDILINYHQNLILPEEKERAKLILDNLSMSTNKTEFAQFYNNHLSEISPALKNYIKDNNYKIDGVKLGIPTMAEQFLPGEVKKSDVVIKLADVIQGAENDPLASLGEPNILHTDSSALSLASALLAVPCSPLIHEEPVAVQLA
jgi:hypothetical protein